VPSPDPLAFRQSLLQVLEEAPLAQEKKLARLERELSPSQPLYSTIIYILTHLMFAEAEAERHWKKISAHRVALQKALARDVGLRVAILDYFVNLSRELKNPKMIEIAIYERTERSAVSDGLTGLFNHAYFSQALKRELQRSRRHGLKLSLIMLDLDNFKRLNDTRGHVEGDKVLVKTAAIIRESLRTIDVAARYGGEEFALILPETDRGGAFVVAERIRKRIEDHFKHKPGFQATASGGVVTFPEDAGNLEEMVRLADEGLYRSKADGKNRMTVVGGERRRHVRLRVAHPATVTAKVGERARRAEARNVSEGGLLLSLRQPLPLGSHVTVVVRPADSGPLAIRGEVVRSVSSTSAKGRFDVGVRLLGESGDGPSLLVLRRIPNPGVTPAVTAG
jgi:diguanylate cyclase (GGDEF)-like protein